MGGAYPLSRPPKSKDTFLKPYSGPEALYAVQNGLRATQSWNLAVSMNAQGPMAPCWGGKYTREKARVGG